MTIIRTPITSEAQWHGLRKPNIGASEIGALFGDHDYLTVYALSARKLGLADDPLDNEVLRRGRLLEPVALKCLQELHPDWHVAKPDTYYCDRDARLGCTPDCLVRTPDGRYGVVQIKTVEPSVFARKWHDDDGEIVPPDWIRLQVILEAHLTQRDFAMIAVLAVGHGVHFELIEVPFDDYLIESIYQRASLFWITVDAGKTMDPDYGRDATTINLLHRQDDGSELDLTGDNEFADLAARYDNATQARQMTEKIADELKARIMHRIGDAQRVTFSGGSLSAKTVNRKEYVVKASSYRRLSVRLNNVAPDFTFSFVRPMNEDAT